MLVRIPIASAPYAPPPPRPVEGRRPPPLVRWREPYRAYDVMEPDGTYYGQIRTPLNESAASVRGDVLWCVHTDADGVQSLRRYVIEWGR